MQATSQNRVENRADKGRNRRLFLKRSLILSTAGTAAGMGLFSSCSGGSQGQTGPAEHLTGEHATLRRIMFIYDHCTQLLAGGRSFDLSLLTAAAGIIRSFVEDYHERMEEEVIFPLFTGKNQMVQLVQALSIQHKTGRELTDNIILIAEGGSVDDGDIREELIGYLGAFNNMYRPHAAIEDAALFASLRTTVPEKTYHSLEEELDDRALEILGQNGRESLASEVADMEREFGIDELSQFV